MEYTEINHLEKNDPIVGELYWELIEKLQQFGPLKIEPKKTSIHLLNRFGFAGLYTRKNFINLEVHLNYKLTGPRIIRFEQASANRFHHTVKIASVQDIDEELLSWLKEAYELKK